MATVVMVGVIMTLSPYHIYHTPKSVPFFKTRDIMWQDVGVQKG